MKEVPFAPPLTLPSGATPSDGPRPSRPYRTLFISDVHLGTRGCQAGMLKEFLDHHDADHIYLVGDIFDGWRLRRGWHWPQTHNDVIEALLAKAHAGVPITYIPGNHDEVMRSYLGTHFGGVEVKAEDVHVTADGKRMLVTHGDRYDVVVMNAKWLAYLGDRAYNLILMANTWLNRLKRLWGGQYWSLSNWAKQQVKGAVNFIGEYEKVLADEATRGGFDGIICGHIHKAEMTDIGGVTYVNCGDWIESCTAIVEMPDGTLNLVDWSRDPRSDQQRERVRRRRRRALRRAHGTGKPPTGSPADSTAESTADPLPPPPIEPAANRASPDLGA
ncbi:MAG: UDP-2,3-diacylglucosamine diphosphatase [Pseudomonadota bacterium]